MAKTTTPKPPAVPLIDDDPGYAAATAKLADLQAKHAEASSATSRFIEQLKGRGTTNKLQAEAAAILAGADVAVDDIESDRQLITKLQRTEAAYLLAIEQQQKIVGDEMAAANMRLQAKFRELYTPLVKATTEAALALARAVEAEKLFKSQLERQGLGLRPDNDTPARNCFGAINCDWRAGAARYLRAVVTNYPEVLPEVPSDFLPR